MGGPFWRSESPEHLHALSSVAIASLRALQQLVAEALGQRLEVLAGRGDLAWASRRCRRARGKGLFLRAGDAIAGEGGQPSIIGWVRTATASGATLQGQGLRCG
jgi:hypothetical protein